MLAVRILLFLATSSAHLVGAEQQAKSTCPGGKDACPEVADVLLQRQTPTGPTRATSGMEDEGVPDEKGEILHDFADDAADQDVEEEGAGESEEESDVVLIEEAGNETIDGIPGWTGYKKIKLNFLKKIDKRLAFELWYGARMTTSRAQLWYRVYISGQRKIRDFVGCAVTKGGGRKANCKNIPWSVNTGTKWAGKLNFGIWWKSNGDVMMKICSTFSKPKEFGLSALGCIGVKSWIKVGKQSRNVDQR